MYLIIIVMFDFKKVEDKLFDEYPADTKGWANIGWLLDHRL